MENQKDIEMEATNMHNNRSLIMKDCMKKLDYRQTDLITEDLEARVGPITSLITEIF